MMYLAFYGNSYGGVLNKLVRWWTSPLSYKFNNKWSKTFSHVEIVFSDGMMFSASQYENNVRFKKHSFTGKAWVRYNLCINSADEARIRESCNELVKIDTKYDYLGILGFVLPFNTQDKNKEFCSEVCTMELLPYVKELSSLTPYKTSPNTMAFALGIL